MGGTAVSRVVCLHVLFQILYLDHVEGDGRLLFVYGFAVIRTSESHQMSKTKKGGGVTQRHFWESTALDPGPHPTYSCYPAAKIGPLQKG